VKFFLKVKKKMTCPIRQLRCPKNKPQCGKVQCGRPIQPGEQMCPKHKSVLGSLSARELKEQIQATQNREYYVEPLQDAEEYVLIGANAENWAKQTHALIIALETNFQAQITPLRRKKAELQADIDNETRDKALAEEKLRLLRQQLSEGTKKGKRASELNTEIERLEILINARNDEISEQTQQLQEIQEKLDACDKSINAFTRISSENLQASTTTLNTLKARRVRAREEGETERNVRVHT
jgi:chromosome segregation ATPase